MKAKLLFIGLDGANLPFILKFLDDGVLPNIKYLVDRGGLQELFPCPPCDTPTNWTSLVTGSWTGTHGVTSFETHLPGTSFADRAKGSWDTRICQAEYLWDLLTEEDYRCLLLDFPPSRPVLNDKLMVVGGWDTTESEGLYPGTLKRDTRFVDFCRYNPNPQSLEQELRELRSGKDFSDLYNTQEFTSEEVLDKERQYNYYLADAACYLFDTYNWNTLFLHLHTIDNVNHTYLNHIWPEHPDYDPDLSEQSWDIFRETYKMVDEVVGRIIEHCADSSTLICLCSDHGVVPSSKMIWHGAALARHGLISYRIDPQTGEYALDVSNSKTAFQFGTTEYIWVNLKGREKDGIVEQGAEYERTVERIIEALSSIKDPETGNSPYSLIARKQDLQSLGQWGERVGDVIVFAKPEYYVVDFGHNKRWQRTRTSGTAADAGLAALFASGDVSLERNYGVQGLHHGHLPTDRLGPAYNSGILAMSGPGTAKGAGDKKPIWTSDVAPTITELLGVRKLAQADGRVITDLIER